MPVILFDEAVDRSHVSSRSSRSPLLNMVGQKCPEASSLIKFYNL